MPRAKKTTKVTRKPKVKEIEFLTKVVKGAKRVFASKH